MSTVEQRSAASTTTAVPPLADGQRLGQAEFHRRYEAMPPRTRAELVGGIVHMPSPMSRRSRRVDARYHPLARPLPPAYAGRPPGRWRDAHPGRLRRARSPTRCCASSPNEEALAAVNEENYLTGPPELIVEVARSSRPFDLGGKRDDYERAGVQEYIVVALDPDEIHWHVRRGDRLERIPPDPDGLYRSTAFPGLWLDPAALLTGDLEGIIATLERGLATPEHAAFVARLADAAARHTNGD